MRNTLRIGSGSLPGLFEALRTFCCEGTPPMHPTLRLISAALTTTLLCVLTSGCSGWGTSRWAMDDPVYSQKYGEPYSDKTTDKLARMLKQSADARYVDDRSGLYLGAAGSDHPLTAGTEIGVFHYLDPSLETRAGLKGLIGTGAKDWFLGGDFGLRLQSPSRLAPFVGVGTFVGGNRRSELAIHDHVDNDRDGAVDERGEYKGVYSYMASVYPELGIHFWLNGQTRLTTGAQYHLTTEGRDDDFWFFGVSLSLLGDPPPRPQPSPAPQGEI